MLGISFAVATFVPEALCLMLLLRLVCRDEIQLGSQL